MVKVIYHDSNGFVMLWYDLSVNTHCPRKGLQMKQKIMRLFTLTDASSFLGFSQLLNFQLFNHDTCFVQQIQTINNPILTAIYHPFYSGLNNELGALNTG